MRRELHPGTADVPGQESLGVLGVLAAQCVENQPVPELTTHILSRPPSATKLRR